MIKSISLNGEWRLRAIGKIPSGIEFPGTAFKGNVPGTVHTDLMSSGVIPDPFYRDNESKVQWIENLDWEYSKEFGLDAVEVSYPTIYLTFEGIDTVAEIFLNNVRILCTRNMFVTHRVRIEKIVRSGKNSLRVVIHSPKGFAVKQEQKHGKIFAELDSYRVHIRKAQYSFGWDWGPRLATSGIWKDARIDFVRDVFIDDTHFSTLNINRGKVEALFTGKFLPSPGRNMRGKNIRLSVSDDKISKEFIFPFAKSLRKKVKLGKIDLWWTRDFGIPKLYDIRIDVINEKDEVIASRDFKTGFKVVRLLRERDKFGESFIFELNGKRIFARGADWIPSDSFLPRLKPDDYQTLVRAARDANMNMLRVWGGGIYEDEEFYNACDENGILIWQDFMFACASYPEYKEFVSEVETEAVQNVRRISNHPCIAMFCGNNESEWIWQQKVGKSVDEMPGTSIFKKTLRDIVRKESPEIPYWRSSPFGGDGPNDERKGDHHQWEVWSYFKSPAEYKKNNARFVSEFGFQAPPSLAAIEDFTKTEDRDMQSPIMRFHNKQIEGTERLYRFASGEVKIAKNFDDVVLQMQLVQAKAIKTGVEHWRKRKWNTAGTLFWQLNDCWPVSSWSAVDYYGRPKALYYWAKNFYKPVKLIIDDDDDRAAVHLVNDTLEALEVELEVAIVDVRGNILKNYSRDIYLKLNSVSLLRKFSMREYQKEGTVIYAKITDPRDGQIIDEDEHILVPWLDFQFDVPKVEVNVSGEGDRKLLRLKSDRFIQGVFLPLNERVNELSDNFFSLIPNVEKKIECSGGLVSSGIHLKFPLLSRQGFV